MKIASRGELRGDFYEEIRFTRIMQESEDFGIISFTYISRKF
jgi:hypothetical protein